MWFITCLKICIIFVIYKILYHFLCSYFGHVTLKIRLPEHPVSLVLSFGCNLRQIVSWEGWFSTIWFVDMGAPISFSIHSRIKGYQLRKVREELSLIVSSLSLSHEVIPVDEPTRSVSSGIWDTRVWPSWGLVVGLFYVLKGPSSTDRSLIRVFIKGFSVVHVVLCSLVLGSCHIFLCLLSFSGWILGSQ